MQVKNSPVFDSNVGAGADSEQSLPPARGDFVMNPAAGMQSLLLSVRSAVNNTFPAIEHCRPLVSNKSNSLVHEAL